MLRYGRWSAFSRWWIPSLIRQEVSCYKQFRHLINEQCGCESQWGLKPRTTLLAWKPVGNYCTPQHLSLDYWLDLGGLQVNFSYCWSVDVLRDSGYRICISDQMQVVLSSENLGQKLQDVHTGITQCKSSYSSSSHGPAGHQAMSLIPNFHTDTMVRLKSRRKLRKLKGSCSLCNNHDGWKLIFP